MIKKKKYIFTNKDHTPQAIMSTVLGTISITALCVSIYLTFQAGGDAASEYGASVFLALLFSITGTVLAVLALRKRETYKLFSIIGLVLNSLALISISLILYAGAYGK